MVFFLGVDSFLVSFFGEARLAGIFSLVIFENFRDWTESGAMLRARAVSFQSFLMSGGAIADVFFKTVLWIFFCDVLNHILVPRNFGDDGGRRDFANFVVAFYAGGGVLFEWSASKEIDFAVNDNLGKRCVKALN